MLSWFLQNIWRVEPEDVDSAICDGGGDKGIDALIIDDDLQEITVFQGKWREKPAKTTQGDSELKSLVGAADYFQNTHTIEALLESKPNQELRNLIVRQEVVEKIDAGSHAVKLVFVTNADLDAAGADYIGARSALTPPLDVWDRSMLIDAAERTRRPDLRPESVELEVASVTESVRLTSSERMAVAIIPARELVTLPGIADHTLFSRNVRLFAGRTRINKQLRETVRTLDEHRLFPAYHNGMTLLTDSLSIEGNKVILDRVGVVNGCQSLITLSDNKDAITDDLLIVVKVVEVPSDSSVADRITYRSNNQNAVTLRDQRSSDPVMRDLQTSVRETFGTTFGFQVRVGENLGAATVLENTHAAQLIMAAYLLEPWSAVRKVRLFDQDYRRIFNRTITAYKLWLLQLIDSTVVSARTNLRDDLRASFASVRFTVVYLVTQVLRESEAGRQLLEEPQRWLRDTEGDVMQSLNTIATEVVSSVNFHVDSELSVNAAYDPKIAFKSQQGVKRLEIDVLRDARREVARGRSYLFTVSPSPR